MARMSVDDVVVVGDLVFDHDLRPTPIDGTTIYTVRQDDAHDRLDNVVVMATVRATLDTDAGDSLPKNWMTMMIHRPTHDGSVVR